MSKQSIIIVGAGHAHLHLALEARRFRAGAARVVLLDPGVFWYSGLATGMLGGMYSRRADQLNPRKLIESNGGEFIEGRVERIDLRSRNLFLEGGDALAYDYLSFNLGSTTDTHGIAGADEFGWKVKPISNLWALRSRLEERFSSGCDRTRILVIGGGATGCEVAANIDALARRHRADRDVTICTRSVRLLPQQAKGADAWLLRHFHERGIQVRFREQIVSLKKDIAITETDKELAYDHAILATGLRPPDFFNHSGLTTGRDGGLQVNEFLQSEDDPRIFGAGDCIHFNNHPLPKLGVFGVRQAPVLLHNLLALLNGRELKPYRPQKKWLSILNLGNGQALAMRGNMYWAGRSSLWLKERLDSGFMKKYR